MTDHVDRVVDRITRAADSRWKGAELRGVRRLPGGFSSLTYAAVLARPAQPDEQVVIKFAPPGLPPVRNRDMLRQARLLRAVSDTDTIPVPPVLLEEDGDPPWFVMGFIQGSSFEPLTDPTTTPPPPQEVDAREREAARALARLHGLHPRQSGFADEPVVSNRGELERWHRALQTVDDSLRPGDEELYHRLVERIPEELSPVVVHGDYRLGNMLFDGPRLTAVIDWEIWSLGDPRFDLAWLLMYTENVDEPNRTSDDPAVRRAAEAVPSKEELLREYLGVRAMPTEDLAWFLALTQYKAVAVVALLFKHARKRGEPLFTREGVLAASVHRGHEYLSSRLAV